MIIEEETEDINLLKNMIKIAMASSEPSKDVFGFSICEHFQKIDNEKKYLIYTNFLAFLLKTNLPTNESLSKPSLIFCLSTFGTGSFTTT